MELLNILLILCASTNLSFAQSGNKDSQPFNPQFEEGSYQEKTPATIDYASYSASPSRSVSNPDYALGTYKSSFYYPSDFQRIPNYGHNLSLRSLVLPGDLVYERNQIGAIGHIGIVLDVSAYSPFGYIIRTVEAVGTQVQYCYLDDVRFVEKNMAILRVSSRPNYYEDALTFAEAQIGDSYSYPLEGRVNTDITSDTWYCSELTYAAYYYAGLNLAAGSDWSPSSGENIMPEDIYDSHNTAQLAILPQFLNLSILGKNGFDWNVNIYNPNGALTVYYPQKMCWSGSARDWKESELLDITSFTAAQHSYTPVIITENWWATSIAASFISGDIRCISFAYYLDAGTLTLSRNYSYQWA